MDIFFWKCGVLLQHLNSVSLFFHKWLQRHAELLGNWFYTPLALKRWKIKKCGTIPFVRIVCDHHKYINIHQNKHPKICRKWAYIVQKCQWSTIQSLNWNKFCFYLFFLFSPIMLYWKYITFTFASDPSEQLKNNQDGGLSHYKLCKVKSQERNEVTPDTTTQTYSGWYFKPL